MENNSARPLNTLADDSAPSTISASPANTVRLEAGRNVMLVHSWGTQQKAKSRTSMVDYESVSATFTVC